MMKTCIDFYDDSAQNWADDWYGNEQLLPYLKKLIEYTQKKSPKILDLCCGAGYESMRLKNLGAEVVGADLSIKSLEIARKKNPTIPFYVKDMLEPYSDLGKFDGIACIAGIVHIDKQQLQTVFKNMFDVLQENGYLLLVFKEGVGVKETSTFNNQLYARHFVFHTKDELEEYSKKYFKFYEDLTPADDSTGWKYYIYRKISA